MDLKERRQHARIEALLSCELGPPGRGVEGKLSNLSIGGAGVLAKAGLGQLGDTLTLVIQKSGAQERISLSAAVVRVGMEGSETAYGLRFAPLSVTQEESLLKLLKDVAAGRGTGTRQHPRIQHRLHIILKSGEELHATLNDLSWGGLALTCDAPLQAGQEMTATLGTTLLPTLLEVTGQVTHALELQPGKYRVGMSFSPMGTTQRQRIQSLIDLLLEVGDRSPSA